MNKPKTVIFQIDNPDIGVGNNIYYFKRVKKNNKKVLEPNKMMLDGSQKKILLDS